MTRQIIVRREEVCASCGATNLFRKTCGTRTTSGGLKVAWARCGSCGQLAQIRLCPDIGRGPIDAK
jgi:hypothetical protein